MYKTKKFWPALLGTRRQQKMPCIILIWDQKTSTGLGILMIWNSILTFHTRLPLALNGDHTKNNWWYRTCRQVQKVAIYKTQSRFWHIFYKLLGITGCSSALVIEHNQYHLARKTPDLAKIALNKWRGLLIWRRCELHPSLVKSYWRPFHTIEMRSFPWQTIIGARSTPLKWGPFLGVTELWSPCDGLNVDVHVEALCHKLRLRDSAGEQPPGAKLQYVS